jgi:hypothetical protein
LKSSSHRLRERKGARHLHWRVCTDSDERELILRASDIIITALRSIIDARWGGARLSATPQTFERPAPDHGATHHPSGHVFLILNVTENL